MDTAFFGGAGALLFVLALALIVCWVILPFAVIGTKPLLRQLLREQQRTNQLLEQLASSGRTAAPLVSRHQDPVTPAKPFVMPEVRDLP